jgi:hypothetical protein
MNKLNQIQEIVRLCYEINEATGFCAFFRYSGHVNSYESTICRGKVSQEFFNSKVYEGSYDYLEVQIDQLRKFIMPEVVEMGRLFEKKDGVTIDKTFPREDLPRIVKWAENMGVELTEKNLAFKKYNRVVIDGVEHISGEIE